jgi:DNA polymerase-1
MLNLHDPGRLTASQYYYDYANPLAQMFVEISRRGIAVDTIKLAALRSEVDKEIQSACDRIAVILGIKGITACAPPVGKLPTGTLNLSSPQQIITILKNLKMNVPKKRRANGAYSESTDEESLNELYAKTGHQFLKELQRVRELNKLLGTYLSIQLEHDTLYGEYFVTGTVTGRRSCRENFLGLGTNLQNQPKHTDLAGRYRECLVARPERIFVKCDQQAAEDWIVCGLIADQSGDRTGLNELLNGVDRHAELAAFIFNKPVAQCGKDTPERFMGKKIRHAGNYDMEAFRFACEMAKEGHNIKENICNWMLERFHLRNPGIRRVFHKYVQDQLYTTRCLTNPFGFTRQFFGLRPYDDNKKLMKEGYAQIPQGTVGTNTGFAILWLERNCPGHVLLDDHDAVTLEVSDGSASVVDAVKSLQTAFDRIIRFPNGLELTIPIEVEIGYDLHHMKTVKCDLSSVAGLTSIYAGLKTSPKVPVPTTSGQQQPLSVVR